MSRQIELRVPGKGLFLSAWAGAAVLLAVPASSLFQGRVAEQAAEPQIARYEHHVALAKASRGCRWQSSIDTTIQVAECGDEQESVRLVFERDRIVEYRVILQKGLATPTPGHVASSFATPARTPIPPRG